MKRLTLTSLLLLTLMGLVPVATSCGGTAYELGTETGNPPVLDRARLRLELKAVGVEIVGDAGAVTPGGALVTAKNLATGETRSVNAGSDGSFRVALGGSLEDGYEVTVSSGGMTATLGVGGTPADGSVCDAAPLLVARCGQAGCHGAGSGFSAFAASTSAAELFVDVLPAAVGPECGPIIDSADPDESLLLRKVQGTQGTCGSQMPLGPPLTNAEIDCIESWLQSFGN